MIPVQDDFEIIEQEDGTFTLIKHEDDWIYGIFSDYPSALKEYIALHNCHKASHLIAVFFQHYQAVDIPLRMHLSEEENLEESYMNGFSDHFLSHAYRHYIKDKCKKLYAQLTSYMGSHRGQYDFEILEMREYLLKLFDVVKDYEHELHEWVELYHSPGKEEETDEE